MPTDADDENNLRLRTIGYYSVVYTGVAVIILIAVPGVTPLSDVTGESSEFSIGSSILSDESESTVPSTSGSESDSSDPQASGSGGSQGSSASGGGSSSSGPSGSGGGSGSTDSSKSDDMPEFQLSILDRDPCETDSRLCREVDVEFHNTGGTATDVEIDVSIVTEGIFSNSTLYTTTDSVKKLKSDEKIQRTEQINIGASDIPAIKANGCRVAAKVDISSNEITETYWTDAQKVNCSP